MSTASIERDALVEATAWVAKAIPGRPSTPILVGARLVAEGDSLTIAAFNYELGHTATVHAVVDGDGFEVLVPGHKLRDVVAALRGSDVLISHDGTSAVRIRAGRTELQLPTLPLEDYPTWPETPPVSGRAAASDLQRIIKQLSWAVGNDDMLPVLTGLHLTGSQGGPLRAEATNRFVLAVLEIPWNGTGDLDLLAHGSSLALATAGLAGDVDVAANRSTLALLTDDRQVTLRLLDGSFPKIQSLITPEDAWQTRVVATTDELLVAAKQAALACEPKDPIVLDIDTTQNLLTVSGGTDNTAATAPLDVDVDGDALSIGVAPAFLRDAITAAGADAVVLGGSGKAKPIIVRPSDDAGDPDRPFTALVMPRRGATR